MTETVPGTRSESRRDSKAGRDDLAGKQTLDVGEAFPRGDEVIVQPNRSELAETAAGMVAAASLISIEQRGAFNVALAGGSTPGPVYERLATVPDIDWKRWRIFWSDERCVSPEHADSNYRMVRETLLDRLPLAPGLVARMPGELSPEQAASSYEKTIRKNVSSDGTGIPRFDLVLLGMGDDGHTASLFPGSQVLKENDRLVAADYVSKFDSYRLTFTHPLINAGRHVLVLVSGASKAATLNAVLTGPRQPSALPVQGVQPTAGQFRWLVDADAAQSIQP